MGFFCKSLPSCNSMALFLNFHRFSHFLHGQIKLLCLFAMHRSSWKVIVDKKETLATHEKNNILTKKYNNGSYNVKVLVNTLIKILGKKLQTTHIWLFDDSVYWLTTCYKDDTIICYHCNLFTNLNQDSYFLSLSFLPFNKLLFQICFLLLQFSYKFFSLSYGWPSSLCCSSFCSPPFSYIFSPLPLSPHSLLVFCSYQLKDSRSTL